MLKNSSSHLAIPDLSSGTQPMQRSVLVSAGISGSLKQPDVLP